MNAQLDPRAPVLADNPREWPATPEAVLALLGKKDAPWLRHSDRCIGQVRREWNPVTNRWSTVPTGIVCAADCPVKLMEKLTADRWFLIRSYEKWRCRRCRGKHPYLTLGCVERPFNGWTMIMQAITEVTRTERHVDEKIGAVHLGTLVPITAEKAAQLKGKIAARGFRI